MPIWVGFLGFPLGIALVVYAFWKPSEDSPWYDPYRPTALFWGIAALAIALDAAIFGYLPFWGD